MQQVYDNRPCADEKGWYGPLITGLKTTEFTVKTYEPKPMETYKWCKWNFDKGLTDPDVKSNSIWKEDDFYQD